MTDEIDFPRMFEGLEPDKAKELTARISQAVVREYNNFTKGEPKMNDLNDILNSLTEDEKQGLVEHLEGVQARREAGKKHAEEAKLIAELAQLQKFPTRNKQRIQQIVKILGW